MKFLENGSRPQPPTSHIKLHHTHSVSAGPLLIERNGLSDIEVFVWCRERPCWYRMYRVSLCIRKAFFHIRERLLHQKGRFTLYQAISDILYRTLTGTVYHTYMIQNLFTIQWLSDIVCLLLCIIYRGIYIEINIPYMRDQYSETSISRIQRSISRIGINIRIWEINIPYKDQYPVYRDQFPV